MSLFDERHPSDGGRTGHPQADIEAPHERWPTLIPGSRGLLLVLGHSSLGAVAITGLQCYPDGFVVTVTSVARQGNLLDMTEVGYDWQGDGPIPDECFRFGVRFANGGAATNLDDYRPTVTSDRDPRLELFGGNRDAFRGTDHYWITPSPSSGPVTFVCEWPALGITAAQAEIDAEIIRKCAAEAFDPWPA